MISPKLFSPSMLSHRRNKTPIRDFTLPSVTIKYNDPLPEKEQEFTSLVKELISTIRSHNLTTQSNVDTKRNRLVQKSLELPKRITIMQSKENNLVKSIRKEQ